MKPRIRTVKPELLKHELLFDLEKQTGLPMRIAWVGMFTIADREGRFEWRPRTLKAEIMPYDEGLDFSRLLEAWEKAKMIYRYEVNGESFGWIPTFDRHQTINQREAQSDLPEPPMEIIELHMRARARTGKARVEGKGKEGNGTEGKGGAPSADPSTPDSSIPGGGPFQADPEINPDPVTAFVLSYVFPITQREWLKKHGAEILNESLRRAISKKLGKLKTKDPRHHNDWPGYLENWFKNERSVKFESSPSPKRARAAPHAVEIKPMTADEILNSVSAAKRMGFSPEVIAHIERTTGSAS